ncbi:MAG: Asp-tRNA(Asn)/Glu-tRNA(Gln) amidotransferase subunit GatC [Magnetococcales bacterium]|nr:Asp-tRNA(Asn)/Glu-tRNA(Gln) amidotransferase subunit GatC [Magnetococcales bacterium]
MHATVFQRTLTHFPEGSRSPPTQHIKRSCPMAITPEIVSHVATLARLAIPDQEVTLYAGQLSNILQLMQRLDQLDTTSVAPMSHAVEMTMPERPDRVVNGNQRDTLLACAPDPAPQGFFRVPKIIE